MPNNADDLCQNNLETEITQRTTRLAASGTEFCFLLFGFRKEPLLHLTPNLPSDAAQGEASATMADRKRHTSP